MTARRRLSEPEIDLLDALGRRFRSATGTESEAMATTRLVDEAQRLHATGCTWRSIAAHLGVPERRLRQLRIARPLLAEATIATPRRPGPMIRLAVDEHVAAQPSQSWMSASTYSTANSIHQASSLSTDSITETATGYWLYENAGVVLAFGMPDSKNPQRFRHESRRLSREFPRHQKPEVHHKVEPSDLQSLSARRPFVLHVGADRKMGATFLSDGRGGKTGVLDDDLVRLLVPDDAAHAAVLVLSFCNSVEVADKLLDRDLAVISFVGDLEDAAAADFSQQLVRAMNLGGTVRMAFESGQAAVRGSYGAEPWISPPSSAHDRVLPWT